MMIMMIKMTMKIKIIVMHKKIILIMLMEVFTRPTAIIIPKLKSL